jgi:hypothetical protein
MISGMRTEADFKRRLRYYDCSGEEFVVLGLATNQDQENNGSSGFLIGLYNALWFRPEQNPHYLMSWEDGLGGSLGLPPIHHPGD